MSAVVALDTFDPVGTEYMREVFPDIIEPDHASYTTWPDHAVGLLVAKSYVTADMISKSKRLRYIVRHGAGYDNVDVEACKKKGIIMCNCPGVSVRAVCSCKFELARYRQLTQSKATSVAEVVLTLTCACAKNLVEVSRQIRAGETLNKRFRSLYSAATLTGKTFGIIGGGTIGQIVAKKLYVGPSRRLNMRLGI